MSDEGESSKGESSQFVEVNKNEMRGKCLTCRRGQFFLGVVWCMHPTLKSGYKLHSAWDTCDGWELSWEFKQMKNMIRFRKDGKPIEEGD